MKTHPFEEFLSVFSPSLCKKTVELNKAIWILETTGSKDAADLKAKLDTEVRLLFNDPSIYQKLVSWDTDPSLTDPLLKRQLNILIRLFKQYCIPIHLLQSIVELETDLLLTYANFRPIFDGKEQSENGIRAILREEENPAVRKAAWEASKQIGEILSPKILSLVKLRNLAAESIGYSDYFSMQLELQEVNPLRLFSLFEECCSLSEEAYTKTIEEIQEELASRFSVPRDTIGPWAWSEPFCQENPSSSKELDRLAEGIDLCSVAKKFYEKMGIDVTPVLDRSDLFEKPGKDQHAFCINIDRNGDVRTLNNLRPTLKWLETLLHELGHAIYELGFAEDLPWILKEPPHMITTEAMALIAGRQAYLKELLESLPGSSPSLIAKAEKNLRGRQLVFSRFVLVMTYFEKELYKNPDGDLQAFWWKLVEKYQKISAPKKREDKNDWAAKYHVGLAPAYYYSYLVGEMVASALQEMLLAETGSSSIATKKAGQLLRERLFAPGNTLPFEDLVLRATGKSVSCNAWIKQFVK